MRNNPCGGFRRLVPTACLAAAALLTVTCKGEEEMYPNLVTEMSEGLTDGDGRLTLLRTDAGTIYRLANPRKGFRPRTGYRLMAGYVVEGEGKARLYTLAGGRLLRDSTASRQRDAFTLVSAWTSPRYLNLHLRAPGQGGTHHWGYAIDSTTSAATHLSLHHHRATGSPAYTADFYASIPWDSLPAGRLILEQRHEFQR